MDKTHEKGFVGKLVLLGIVGLVALFLVMPFLNKNTNNQPTSNQANRSTNDMVESIIANPQPYYGKTVTVSSVMNDQISDNAFVLNAQGIPSQDLLVVSRDSLLARGGGPEDFLYEKNDRLKVTGQVMLFNRESIENITNIDLSGNAFSGYEGKPVIVADSISIE